MSSILPIMVIFLSMSAFILTKQRIYSEYFVPHTRVILIALLLTLCNMLGISNDQVILVLYCLAISGVLFLIKGAIDLRHTFWVLLGNIMIVMVDQYLSISWSDIKIFVIGIIQQAMIASFMLCFVMALSLLMITSTGSKKRIMGYFSWQQAQCHFSYSCVASLILLQLRSYMLTSSKLMHLFAVVMILCVIGILMYQYHRVAFCWKKACMHYSLLMMASALSYQIVS